MKEDFNLLRYTIELTYIKKLNELKWWQFSKRKEVNKWRELQLNVSQQRELLKKWWKYFDEESVAINCNDEEREQVINDFFNCG